MWRRPHKLEPIQLHVTCLRWQVGVDLGKPGYLEEVAKQTADIDIAIVFCNAGYMLTGFFDSMCDVQPAVDRPQQALPPRM